jgi:hypothetical protein
MTWVKGQSGNPKGKKPGQLNRRAQAIIADLQLKGMAPDAMGKAMIKAMAEIALDPREPKQLRIQATSVVLPYCMARLQVTAQVTHNTRDFSRAQSKEELMQMVRDELGKGAVGVLEEMMERLEKGEDVDAIDAEIVSDTTVAGSTATKQQSASQSEPQPDRAPEPAGS